MLIMENAVTKSSLSWALGEAIFALDKSAKAYSCIGEVAVGLPDAFPVVAKRLPDLLAALRGIESSLEATPADQEKPEAKEKYGAALQLAEACRVQAGYLQGLIEAVTPRAAGETIKVRMARYRAAVEKVEGGTVEGVLRKLLEAAVNVAPALLDGNDDERVEKLREALAEVSQLQPSLEKPTKDRGSVTLNNYDQGMQFYHGGEGNQNHNSGSGVMITGRGATNNFDRGYGPGRT